MPHRRAMRGDTRKRILVTSLLLFNEHGEPATTTNEIADEVDISPGNLHYHFRKKRQIVEALLDEFQADARRVLTQPEHALLDDFWVFLHLLLELRGILERGSSIALYMVLYGFMRFLTELIRTDTEFRFLGLSRNGWVSMGVVLAGIAVLVWRQRRGEPQEAMAPVEG